MGGEQSRESGGGAHFEDDAVPGSPHSSTRSEDDSVPAETVIPAVSRGGQGDTSRAKALRQWAEDHRVDADDQHEANIHGLTGVNDNNNDDNDDDDDGRSRNSYDSGGGDVAGDLTPHYPSRSPSSGSASSSSHTTTTTTSPSTRGSGGSLLDETLDEWTQWASEVVMRAAVAGTDAVSALVTPLKPRHRRPSLSGGEEESTTEDGDCNHSVHSDHTGYSLNNSHGEEKSGRVSGDSAPGDANGGNQVERGDVQRPPLQEPPQLPPPANEKAFAELYEVGESIGTGYSANVHVATHRATGRRFAVKIIEKSRMPAEMLTNEVKVLRTVRHPNIVSFVDLFETGTKLFLVLELATEGELFDRIVERGAYPEHEARRIVHTIARTVQYLHENGVMHRDLKPENVLFTRRVGGKGTGDTPRGEDTMEETIKLADFGFSTLYDAECTITVDCGSGEYAAPELILRQSCTFASDIWSLGVIIYILLSGFHPFHSENRVLFMKRIVTADYVLDGPEWDAVSEEAKDVVRCTLVVDPAKRLTAEEICNHPWFSSALQGRGTGET